MSSYPFKRRVKSHLPFASIIRRFNVYGSVHFKYIPIYVYIQKYAALHSLFISGNCSTCFGWYFHSSSGVLPTVSTASGICHTVTAICRFRGRVGTGLSVLWVAYANHSTQLLYELFISVVTRWRIWCNITLQASQLCDNFYAVISSLILVWPLCVRIPESFPNKVVFCVVLLLFFVLCIVCV
jgi:hypothetical protein